MSFFGQETFLQANKEYQEKNYEKALTLYAKIEKKGAATWYNMGNCHYQLGHEADAIACWQRAQKGASKTILQDSAYNIDAVLQGEQKSGSQHALPAPSLLLIQLLFLCVWLFFLFGVYLSKRGKKYKVATFILGIVLVPQGLYLGYRYMHRAELSAIVHKEAKLFAGPNEQYHMVGQVMPKDQLIVYTKNDNWYKVAHGKQMGWVSEDAIAVI